MTETDDLTGQRSGRVPYGGSGKHNNNLYKEMNMLD